MKFFKFIFILPFFVSYFCLAETTWTFHKKYQDVSIYLSQNDTRLVFQHDVLPKNMGEMTEDLVKKLEKTKKEMLEMINVTEWKADQSVVKKIDKNVTQVHLSGSYNDPSNKMVYYVERHFYGPSKKLQILLTNHNKKLLKKDSHSDVINKFRKKYPL